jgi:hypothetical protein
MGQSPQLGRAERNGARRLDDRADHRAEGRPDPVPHARTELAVHVVGPGPAVEGVDHIVDHRGHLRLAS